MLKTIILSVLALISIHSGDQTIQPQISQQATAFLAVEESKKIEEEVDARLRISFVGDIMLDRYVRTNARKNGYDEILESLDPLLGMSDIVVANLEGPITSNPSVSEHSVESGPNNFTFTFSPQVIDTLKKNNITIVSLDNNHIYNFGEEGLENTKKILRENGIDYIGDPSDYENNIFVKDVEGRKFGFTTYNQFLGGKAETVIRNIKKLTKKADTIIVYTHWGDEYEMHPNNNQVTLAHSFIDAGADMVIGSHPHVIQDKEVYKGKAIYYSLGNFIFDQYFSEEVRCGAVVTFDTTNKYRNYTLQENFTYLETDGTTSFSDCGHRVPDRL